MDEVAFEENNAPWAEVTEQSAVTIVKRGPRTQSNYKVIADRRKVRIRHRRVPRGLNIGVFFVVAPSPILHLFLSVCKAHKPVRVQTLDFGATLHRCRGDGIKPAPPSGNAELIGTVAIHQEFPKPLRHLVGRDRGPRKRIERTDLNL